MMLDSVLYLGKNFGSLGSGSCISSWRDLIFIFLIFRLIFYSEVVFVVLNWLKLTDAASVTAVM